ncbi:MAG: sulfatase-like hydrolase/transferase, partial [Planctomycetes bacterium]|nr:sulfatase-like hydrolase/transferase [Planctomycetota bacterium]
MKKFRDTIGLTFLLGALIGAIEGFSLLVFGHYGFREPGWGLLDMQFQYGLLALAFLPFAWLIPKLLRLPYKTATDVSSWAFLGFSWIIANWWIHGEFIRGKSIFSPLSLSLVLISVALVFVLHFAIRKIASQSAKSLFGALLAALILAPILAQSNHKSQSPPTSVQASNADKPDVTVVVIDTLRADHLGTYGYQRADGEQTSPFIDSLAETGLVFENTWSQASWTRPSMASLHSGLFCSG